MNLPLQRCFQSWNLTNRSSTHWLKNEDEFLMQSYANGMTVIEIATMLRRGRDIVQDRLTLLTEQLTTKLAGKCRTCGGDGRISSPMGEAWCPDCY